MSIRSRALMLAAAAVLSACLFPEKFDAKITVRQDASYRIKFNGTVAHVPLVAKSVQTALPLSAAEESSLRNEAAKMAKSPGVTSAEYLGKGRFKLAFEDGRNPGASMNVLDMFKVWTAADGSMTISSAKIDAKQAQSLKSLGLEPQGTIEVELPKNAEVIESNATSKPWFFGLFGAYAWKIGGISQAPMMRIRFQR